MRLATINIPPAEAPPPTATAIVESSLMESVVEEGE